MSDRYSIIVKDEAYYADLRDSSRVRSWLADRMHDNVQWLIAERRALRQEVRFLRDFGEPDHTALADQTLALVRKAGINVEP